MDRDEGERSSMSQAIQTNGDGRKEALHLELTITDPELVAELGAHSEGRARNEFARAALRIGILALKQAQGRLDADLIRQEGDRLIADLEHRLTSHQDKTILQLTGALKDYFDPESGRFNERLRRLIEKDGELERLLRAQIGPADSELSKTLEAFAGTNSPLMKVLTPDESTGLVGTLRQTVDQVLDTQRERILKEFSLDNKDGALTRLVNELGERHGRLTQDLQGSIKEVVGEFSLDNEESALSRLVRRVEQAQRQISGEFSLDEERSALARMRKELLGVLDTHKEATQQFHREVVTALEGMKARKEEAQRSTTHGHAFQDAVFTILQAESQKSGDIAEDTGNTTGQIRNCKVGDAVITLGPDTAAAGARIVVEAKESAGYDLQKSLDEIDLARRNRDAQVGLFIHSQRTAPLGLAPMARYGTDVIVVWDTDDEASDVFLKAGLMVARAMSTSQAAQREEHRADFDAIERAIREIERQAGWLSEITTWTGTIKNNSEKILDRMGKMQKAIHGQVEVLDEKTRALRTVE